MPDNNENSTETKLSKADIIKIIIITLVSMILLTFLLRYAFKENEVIFTVNTLSSEELAGESYTERVVIDDSDMWETEIISSDMTCTESQSETVIRNIVKFPVDINLANVEELMLIDGIGTVTAEKIINYRNMYGYFSNYDQLLNIDGIGEKKLENLMAYIFISDDWLEIESDDAAAFSEVTTLPYFPEMQETISETVTMSKVTTATEEIIIINEEFVTDNEDTDNISEDKYENNQTTVHYVDFPLELNSATVEDLMCIDGIGEYIALNIVNYAQQYGFYSVEDLLDVEGIGNSKMAAIAPYVYVNSYLLPPREESVIQTFETFTEIITTEFLKINVNICGKNELMQLPGIDETLADRIISFRDTIGGFIKIEELTLVEGMTNEKMSAIWDYVYI